MGDAKSSEVAIVDWSASGLVVCSSDEFWLAEAVDKIDSEDCIGDLLSQLGVGALHTIMNCHAIELADSKGEIVFRHHNKGANDDCEWIRFEWNSPVGDVIDGKIQYLAELVRDSTAIPDSFKSEFGVWKGGWFEFEMPAQELEELLTKRGFTVTINAAPF